MGLIDELKEKLRAPAPRPPHRAKLLKGGLSSGSTLVNLACTGDPDVAWLPGHYYLLVGDSQSGKSWLVMQTLAEAARHPAYAKHRLVHDNTEDGTLMDVERYFGTKLPKRLEQPPGGGPSRTVEQLYDRLARLAADGKPYVYALDSEDALTSAAEEKKEARDRNARRKAGDDGADVKGSYGDGKAKLHSQKLRVAEGRLRKDGSLLLFVKQTRDNIGFDAMFNPKTRSGGKALTFYATLELWFSVAGKLKRPAAGKDWQVGSRLKVQVKKNRVAGLPRAVLLDHYAESGIDEVGSNVHYLVDMGAWKGTDKRVEAPEFGFSGPREKLIAMIEGAGREAELRALVVKTWRDIEAACAVRRKPRYE